MKQILLLLSIFLSSVIYASDSIPPFSVKIIDYSLSWTSSTSYTFTNDEMLIVRLDNVEKNKQEILSHRQLLGREKRLMYQYLSILSQIQLQNEYRGEDGGDRNQKRITINMNEAEQSIFVSNTYQQDIAAFVTFLNSFIVEKNRMKEFVDPNKPKNTSNTTLQK